MSAQISTSTLPSTPALTKKQRENVKRQERRLREVEREKAFLKRHHAFLVMDIARANTIETLTSFLTDLQALPRPENDALTLTPAVTSAPIAVLKMFHASALHLQGVDENNASELVSSIIDALESESVFYDEILQTVSDFIGITKADHAADGALAAQLKQRIDFLWNHGWCYDIAADQFCDASVLPSGSSVAA